MPYPNNYFPVNYQYYQPNYQQMMPQPQNMQAQQVQQAQPTVQQNGFVRVQSENDARMYPVAPGNSVTFIDDNAPYCYVKTMDMSQLDRPKFEKYRLVKEEDAPVLRQNAPKTDKSTSEGKDTAYALKTDLDAIWSEIKALKNKSNKETVKKQENEDNE